MTCKECLHYVVCKVVADSGKFVLDIERPDQSQRCPNFKDKSRFVELPCKIGDEVYRVSCLRGKKIILQRQVDGLGYYNDQNEPKWSVTTTEDWEEYWLGEDIFLAREEAERGEV